MTFFDRVRESLFFKSSIYHILIDNKIKTNLGQTWPRNDLYIFFSEQFQYFFLILFIEVEDNEYSKTIEALTYLPKLS